MQNFSGIAQITDDGIKKHFKNMEPYKAALLHKDFITI